MEALNPDYREMTVLLKVAWEKLMHVANSNLLSVSGMAIAFAMFLITIIAFRFTEFRIRFGGRSECTFLREELENLKKRVKTLEDNASKK